MGAFAACGGLATVYALFVYITLPTASAGLDAPERFVAWLAVAGVLLALLVVHYVIGRQLLVLARGESQRP